MTAAKIAKGLKTLTVPIADLVPTTDNARIGDVEAVARSLNRFAQQTPIVWRLQSPKPRARKKKVILKGNHTYLAARDVLGWDKIAAVESDTMTDDEAKAYALADNRTSDLSTWHEEILSGQLTDLMKADESLVTDAGWDDLQLVEFLAKPKFKTKPLRPMPDRGDMDAGTVWDVGPHRLVIGDGTADKTWSALPESELLLTDPPYGVGYEGGPMIGRVKIEDDEDGDVAAAVLAGACDQWLAKSSAGAMSFVFGPAGPGMLDLGAVLVERNLYRWTLVWVKNNAPLGRADFHHKHETIFYGWNPNAARRHPPPDRSQTTVLEFARPSASPDHPTQKPLDLLTYLIEQCSAEGDIVCDPFAGSGSTLVAAANAGRIGIGVELQPEYANVALTRLEAAVGENRRQVK